MYKKADCRWFHLNAGNPEIAVRTTGPTAGGPYVSGRRNWRLLVDRQFPAAIALQEACLGRAE